MKPSGDSFMIKSIMKLLASRHMDFYGCPLEIWHTVPGLARGFAVTTSNYL